MVTGIDPYEDPQTLAVVNAAAIALRARSTEGRLTSAWIALGPSASSSYGIFGSAPPTSAQQRFAASTRDAATASYHVGVQLGVVQSPDIRKVISCTNCESCHGPGRGGRRLTALGPADL